MKVRCLLSDDMVRDLADSDQPVQDIGTVLETIDHMNRYTTAYCRGNAIYEVQCGEKYFFEWLYSRKCAPELVDLKTELMKKIEKSREIDNDEYKEILDRIIHSTLAGELLLSFCKTQIEGLFVWGKESYFDKKRWFLERYVDRCDFVKEAEECFPNLFFHENVEHSLKTLKIEYSREKAHIIAHLTALNDFQPHFLQMSDANCGFIQASREFEEANRGIECSPQADRSSTRQLDFSFVADDGNAKSLRCELHTKLKWSDMNREKQDRIYFHPGDRSVANGKVLIVHIGKHL